MSGQMGRTRLVLISDTHLARVFELPGALVKAIKQADAILHAGDFTSTEAYDGLRSLKPVYGARGNMDDPALSGHLPEVAKIEVLGHKIGVVHGWGPPKGIVARISQRMENRGFEMVVFGHSHYPEITSHAGMLFVNPGSPTDSRFAPFPSFAVVEISQAGIGVPQIVRL